MINQLAKRQVTQDFTYSQLCYIWHVDADQTYHIVKRKMETAMELLQTTTRSVSEISADLHYNNSFYFSRAFKKYFGISPTHARNL